MEGTDRPVLEVHDFSAALIDGPTLRTILSPLSFVLPAGSITGLFGESGCGKTTLALGIMQLLSPHRYRIGGSVRVLGREISNLGERRLRAVRGAQISLIFQDPALALNPVMRVREQILEPARAHGTTADPEAMLRLVGLTDPERIAKSYPHQLSGGQRQRVAIAQALICRPALVIADEPFTSLDAPAALALADLMVDLNRSTGASFLVISHSPGALARIAGSVLLMHGGRLVDQGPPADVFRALVLPGSGNAR